MLEVEFARCLRLRQTSLEPVAFRLPRVRVRLEAQHTNIQLVRGFETSLNLSQSHSFPCSVENLSPYSAAILKLMITLDWGLGFAMPSIPWASLVSASV